MASLRRYVIHGRAVHHAKLVAGHNPLQAHVKVQLSGRRIIEISCQRLYETLDEAQRVLAAEELARLQHIP